MSIREFIARHSKPPSPTPIMPTAPIELETANLNLEIPTSNASYNGECVTQLDMPCSAAQPEDGASFHWDIESRSAAKLGKGKESVGARAYAEHFSTEILCVSFARGNGPVETWVPGQPIPEVVLGRC